MAHDHPDPDDASWDDAATCRQRFADWRENVAGDIGGEWGG